MKKNILTIILSIALILALSPSVLAVSPSPSMSPSAVPAVVNVNELFWPISAGKVSGESMFGLKLLKEKLRSYLIFSKTNKLNYFTTLSTKRIVEAEKLYLTLKDYSNAKKSLVLSTNNREEAMEILSKNQNLDSETKESKSNLKSHLERQVSLLEYIKSQVPDSEKQDISDMNNKINSDLMLLQ